MNLTNLMAHRYLKLGWSVIPVIYKSKVPAIGSWREYQKRLPTEQELDKWFTDDKKNNIALITGSVSGVSILDADGPAGRKSLADLKLSSSVQATSGRGKHLLFADKEGKARNFVKRYPGLDARGEGGYVLIYPSIHENGSQYKWIGSFECELPEFPVSLLPQPREQQTESKTISDCTFTQTQRLQMLEKALPLLKTERVENYDDWIKIGMACKEFGMVGFKLWDAWSKKSTKYIEGATNEKWQTFSEDSGLTIGSIIYWAKEDSGKAIRPEPSQSEFVNRQSQSSISTFSPNGNLTEHKRLLLSKALSKGPELSTGLPLIDKHTWGFVRQEIFTIAARTGVGKTSFAVGVTKNLLLTGKRVLMFSTEMSHALIVNRLLSSYTGLTGDMFKTGSFSSDSEPILDLGYTWLESVGERLAICDFSNPSLQIVKELTEKHKPDVIIFDHIQHISGGQDVRKAISDFVRGLKDIARNTNCAVLVLSQLRRMFRDSKTGILPPPQLSDLKESGTIEEESGQVLLLSELSTEPGTNTCILFGELAKNRYGECIRVAVEFDRSTACFKETVYDEQSNTH